MSNDPVTRQDVSLLNQQIERLTDAVANIEEALVSIVRALQEQQRPAYRPVESPYDASVDRRPR
jgi:hypothetical protein